MPMKMRRSLLVVFFAFFMFTGTTALANSQRKSIFPEKYRFLNQYETFVTLFNTIPSEEGTGIISSITNVKKVANLDLPGIIVYEGSWGNYTTLDIFYDDETDNIYSMILSIPKSYFSTSYTNRYGYSAGVEYFTNLGILSGFLDSSYDLAEEGRQRLASIPIEFVYLDKYSQNYTVGNILYHYETTDTKVIFTVTSLDDSMILKDTDDLDLDGIAYTPSSESSVRKEFYSEWMDSSQLQNHNVSASWMGETIYIAYNDKNHQRREMIISGSPKSHFERGKIYESDGIRYQYVDKLQDGNNTININFLCFNKADLKAKGIIS